MTPTVLLGLAFAVGAPNLKEKEKSPSLVGEWSVESITVNGNQTVSAPGLVYTFTDDGKWLIRRNGKETAPNVTRGFETDPKPNPPTVDLITNTAAAAGTRLMGIYKVEGDTLTICGTRVKGTGRPSKFEAGEGTGNTLYLLKRVNKE